MTEGDSMADIAKPHDRFFKALMASPDAPNALFRERLPRRLVEELADAPPEPVGAELVGARLQSSSADGLFRLWLRGRRPLFVYSLVEHKSAPEPESALQLLGYMVRIWEGEKRRPGAGKRRFSAIPDAIRARIMSGSMAEVNAWFDRAVDAGALGDVFGERH
jgi:hypothetical protein